MQNQRIGPLEVTRGGRRLFNCAQFELQAGRFVELHGTNGSGKTTLLRLLAGLQAVERPEVLNGPPSLGSEEADHPSENRSIPESVFYFAHQTGFRPELNVVKQCQISLQMLGQPATKGVVDQLLAQVGLKPMATRLVGQLSQGQQRRLLLGIMAASHADVWLIDEPLNALDEDGRALFAQLLLRYLVGGGVALIATHQTLDSLLPELAKFKQGELLVRSKEALFVASSVEGVSLGGGSDVPSVGDTSSNMCWILRWSLYRELALFLSRPADVVWPTVFFFMMVSVFPMAVGAQADMLVRIASGVMWVSAMLTTLFTTGRLFEQDYVHGALAQMQSANVSLAQVTLGKLVAIWLVVGIPVMLVSLPLGLLYHLQFMAVLQLSVSLGLGLISLMAVSSVFAALGLMARQSQVVLSLLAIPVFVPLLIFGAAAANAPLQDGWFSAPMAVLASLAALSMLATPWLTSKVLQLALD